MIREWNRKDSGFRAELLKSTTARGLQSFPSLVKCHFPPVSKIGRSLKFPSTRVAMTDLSNDVFAFRAAMDSAVRILSRRNHASAELARKLGRRGYGERVVERVLAECRRLNYLDDTSTAARYVEEFKAKGYGRRFVRKAMHQKGFSAAQIESALMEHYGESEETGAARDALRRKAKTFAREQDGLKRRQKIARYLYARGFSPDVISSLTHCQERDPP